VDLAGALIPAEDGEPSWKGGVDVYRGTAFPVRSIHGTRVGPSFELRAEFDTTAPGSFAVPVGIIFGDQIVGSNFEHWSSCEVLPSRVTGSLNAVYRYRDFAREGAAPVSCEASHHLVFELHVADGRLTWKLNGKTIHDSYKLPEDLQRDARIGIGTMATFTGCTATLRKLQLRKLP
jgi:hypothetical protein